MTTKDKIFSSHWISRKFIQDRYGNSQYIDAWFALEIGLLEETIEMTINEIDEETIG
jgi:hypothetical protein